MFDRSKWVVMNYEADGRSRYEYPRFQTTLPGEQRWICKYHCGVEDISGVAVAGNEGQRALIT